MTDFRITIPETVGQKLYERQIRVANTFMRSAPHPTASCNTEVLFGETFDVYEETEEWACGQLRPRFTTSGTAHQFAGYIGWIHKNALGDSREETTHSVTALRLPIFTSADIKSPVVMILNLNAQITLRDYDDKFSEIEGIGFVHKAHISIKPKYTDCVSVAEMHFGLPYIWGGISTDGLDCSGLVRSSLRAIGKDAPRDADQQEAQLGVLVDRNSEGLQRGDLVFWKGHVGIMQDRTRLIHANAFHMSVKSEPLSEAEKRIKPQSGEITAIKRLKF